MAAREDPPTDPGAVPAGVPGPPHTVVPLFPLAHVWLFPGMILPLHVFEPRYRQMIEDSLDGPGRFVLGTVVEGHEAEMPGAPPVYPIAGLGEIGRHQRLPDGRFLIQLVGLARVRLAERDSPRLYRQVEVEPIEESEPAGETADALREELAKAVRARTEPKLPLPDGMPVGRLADLLVLRMPLAHKTIQELYSEMDAGVRARRALKEHGEQPIVPLE